MALEYEELTEEIISATIEVHRKLGMGFLESIYENALVIELNKRGFEVKQQYETVIYYDEIEIGCHRIDILIDKIIILELKAIKNIENIHSAIVKSYLKAFNLKRGLILNFNKEILYIKRVISFS